MFGDLGVRLSAFPPPGTCLRHEHVEPIALYPVQTSTGEVVYQQLTAAVAHTGVPREILSDGGSDLQAGVARFQRAHPETQAIYDIKHKTALVLKHELAEEARWQAFTQQAAQTKQRVQQTPLAFSAPPAQRRRAVYECGHLDSLGDACLAYSPSRAGLERSRSRQRGYASLRGAGFREPLQDWSELLQIVETTEQWVRSQGLSHGCPKPWHPRWLRYPHRARPARGSTLADLCGDGIRQGGPPRTLPGEQ